MTVTTSRPQTTVLDALAARLAHALSELGVGHGDRVATLLDNRAEQVASFFAALKLGAVQVPVNTAYKGEFLRHQLADSGARVLVVQGDFASRVTALTPRPPDLDTVVAVGAPDAAVTAARVEDWDELLARSPE